MIYQQSNPNSKGSRCLCQWTVIRRVSPQKKQGEETENSVADQIFPTPENTTGIPDDLKAGIEYLCGFSIDDVKVHYNSAKPAELEALAYTQDQDIYIAPGQEQHLPHEVWHVVQQMQGRVQSTLQVQNTSVNDNIILEQEADKMGERANKFKIDRANYISFPKIIKAFQNIIQRKIGLEIEVPMDLQKGTLKTEAERKEVSPFKTKSRELPFISANDGCIKKGQSAIMNGNSWSLTPDGYEDSWYCEYITDPVDEAQSPQGLTRIVEDLKNWVSENLVDLKTGEYIQLAEDYVVGWHPFQKGNEISGSFHVTAGVRLDRIFEMLEKIAKINNTSLENNQDYYQGLLIGKADKIVMVQAVNYTQKINESLEYKGLVALMGSYVGGQYRFINHQNPEMSLNPKIRTGKILVPVLSRTNLGEIRQQVKINNKEKFLNYVLMAAGMTEEQANEPLFPHSLTAGKETGRSIDANPKITISEWVNGVLNGEDQQWSDQDFSMEYVGPEWKTISPEGVSMTHRKQGAVLEIRSFDSYNLPVDQWGDFTTEVVLLFTKLNELR
ncbi:DUF4157 domain-containing protein [Limnoraphis robusta Tam1]|uniref:DUF4157 domain-containing protein n=1 Tax=Limnoraphis robusta CCNP1315 TaxID=3110306 RepID=A0ABU5U189_9CYAN|nr:DUF4157 domain-containing protein [Limnoraphis robusta]MEA5495656.1 DUF4157 domain-containing protein [Limnoraphis robusta BA-68 BA1]MEA5520952.1 DUF4157 domain-containing protein [Limnoraphis robusta CCNP1315]MEA5538756.1 DUF4157 domain-containing protein [Limnoraphis robusta Tam1]MEA5543655.1 DUF4157 domain-containing protein [Limnoraphis robusta CCNP1324]